MFDTGTKIKLIASSCNKKTGPRKGSVGYITELYHLRTKIKGRTIFAIPATCRFTRYGNERKCRAETKSILTILPVVHGNDAENTIKTIISTIGPEKYVSRWNIIRSEVSVATTIPIVLATPMYTPGLDLMMCAHEELQCWLENKILSLSSFTSRAIGTNYLSKEGTSGITENDLLNLREMTVSKQLRRALLEKMCVSPNARNKWIKILLMLSIMSDRSDHEIISDDLRASSNNILNGLSHPKGTFTTNDVYQTLAPYLFCKKFDEYKKIFAKNTEFYKPIKEMEAMKIIILGLSIIN